MSAPVTKSREEILAERRGKKKNKLSAKSKAKGKSESENEGNLQNVPQDKVKESASVNVANPSTLHISNNALPQSNVDDKSESPGQKLIDALQRTSLGGKNPEQSEKSREEILAEREAKRLIKQAAKNKTKVASTESEETKVSKKPVSTEKEAEGKTNAQLKAERRAKQEAQRAKKLATANETKIKEAPKVPQAVKVTKSPQKVAPLVKCAQKVKLFAHLYPELIDTTTIDAFSDIHPSIIRLGTQYSSRVISGSNVRCLALLNALKTLVTDFVTPQNQEFTRGLEAQVTKSMDYLNRCRPVAVSMANAVKHLKFQINRTKLNETEAKNQINEWIETYIKEQLETAAEAICMTVREKISDGDVILTYGCSSLVQRILISAHKEKIKFRMIVADGRPWLEGREMLRKLVSVGIHCTYVFVNGLSFVMPEVTKILLGAHALLANGYVMSRAGSSQIALLAKTYNVPVLVCCETQKFSERVQTDSFVYNELGNPDDLFSNKGSTCKQMSKPKSTPYLTPLNLTYDVTPPDLVSAVVTEIAVLPCTSVPVILRIKPPEISC